MLTVKFTVIQFMKYINAPRAILVYKYSTFSASEYFSEIEKFHGFQHINTSHIN